MVLLFWGIEINMLRIKFHCNYCSDDEIHDRVMKMTPNNSGIWKNLRVVQNNYDIFVIMNHPTYDTYDKSRTIVFESETPTTRSNFPKFYKGHEQEFLYIHDTQNHFNVDLWYHGLTFSELTNPLLFEKNKQFSVINSNLNNLPGHIKRNHFIEYLTNNIEFDLYGRFYSPNRYYKGSLCQKHEGLKNYKYTFNCENDFEPNYFTEKILDGILCEALTFYSGCPNIKRYINENAFIDLDLTNVEESMYIIKDCLKTDIWKSMIPNIREEKRRIMVDYNVLNIVNKILETV